MSHASGPASAQTCEDLGPAFGARFLDPRLPTVSSASPRLFPGDPELCRAFSKSWDTPLECSLGWGPSAQPPETPQGIAQKTLLPTSVNLRRVAHGSRSPATRANGDSLAATGWAPSQPEPCEEEGEGAMPMAQPASPTRRRKAPGGIDGVSWRSAPEVRSKGGRLSRVSLCKAGGAVVGWARSGARSWTRRRRQERRHADVDCESPEPVGGGGPRAARAPASREQAPDAQKAQRRASRAHRGPAPCQALRSLLPLPPESFGADSSCPASVPPDFPPPSEAAAVRRRSGRAKGRHRCRGSTWGCVGEGGRPTWLARGRPLCPVIRMFGRNLTHHLLTWRSVRGFGAGGGGEADFAAPEPPQLSCAGSSRNIANRLPRQRGSQSER